MLIEDLKSIKSGEKELKKFCLAGGTFFLALLIIILLWRKEVSIHLLIISTMLLCFGFIAPKAIKPVYIIWIPITTILGWAITRIILSILFFLVLTPIGVLVKLLGKDPLRLKFDRKANSYWIKKHPIEFDKKRCENQF